MMFMIEAKWVSLRSATVLVRGLLSAHCPLEFRKVKSQKLDKTSTTGVGSERHDQDILIEYRLQQLLLKGRWKLEFVDG